MKEIEKLIVIYGKDRTSEVDYCKKSSGENTNKEKINVKFTNSKQEYPYNAENVVIKEDGKYIDIANKNIYYKNNLLLNVDKMILFEDLVKIIYENNNSEVFEFSNICLKKQKSNNQIQDIVSYFREISKYVSDGDKEGKEKNNETFLESQYKKLNYINSDSVLYKYINKTHLNMNNNVPDNIIYPFKFNISQKQALENVYKDNISVIEGPPGTGKTQTILNIIANLAIMQNKTVAVVSNNNEAVKNVKSKLAKYGYKFINADLGRKNKRENFFEDLPQPNVENFNIEKTFEELLSELKVLNTKLDILLEKNNKKAELENSISAYKLEQQYFNKYYEEQNISKINNLSFYNKTDEKIIDFLVDCHVIKNKKMKYTLFSKIKLLLKYGIKDLKKLDSNLIEIILNLQKDYYELKIKKLESEFEKLKSELSLENFENLQTRHQKISEQILKKKLYEKYNGKKNKFSFETYMKNMDEFIQSFPVILSTTFSLRNSVPQDFLFDYVIIDESSQVDLLAGSLALSCAKNAIIVGDEKQLPQIVDLKIKEKLSSTNVDSCYDYFDNSLLSSIKKVYGNSIPSRLLREHYRCHPKIIEFCNKRYYEGKLISFKGDEHLDVEKPLILYYTSEGNHMRKITRGEKLGTFNERELEVIKEEVICDKRINKYKSNDIGIVSPYRLQADKIANSVDFEYESDTVHKYQGREKNLMILSTVLDDSYLGKIGIRFVDDPCMVNVAVSRAIKQFVIVTHNKLFNEQGKEINALLKYIKYNTLDSEIFKSNIVSVFDLLYKDYNIKLKKLNDRLLNRCRYKSERIVDTILNEELKKEEYGGYYYKTQVLLKNCVKKFNNLTKEETEFVNSSSSVDFVIYEGDNIPKMFIEVDGFEFHENNPKQLKRDRIKDSILKKNNLNFVRIKVEKKYSEEDIRDIIKKSIL